uniref:Major facilitator superfamily (MFS) profile domain-containing protein n=1 Tax=Strigamia maritima TaxID=126957 RepID=T1JHY0_STRMM
MTFDSTEYSVSNENMMLVGRDIPNSKTNSSLHLLLVSQQHLMGLSLGYSSPAIPDMKKPGRRLRLNDQEESLFSSFMTIGALCGGLIAGFIVDYFGRKLSYLITCIPFVMGWLLIAYAESVWTLYFGRIVSGVCVDITCLNTSVYVNEIASPQIRGTLGSWFQLFVNAGILIAYSLGSYVPWTYLALFSAVVPILFMIMMCFMHESPVWLLRQNNVEGAMQSLHFFRGENYDIQGELDDLQREKQNEVELTVKELQNPAIFKPLLIIEVEMCLQQFFGINGVIFNLVTIFGKAKSSMSPNNQGIIVGCVMFVASVVASIFMDKAGRRLLLLIGAFVMCVSMFLLGTFFYLDKYDRETADQLTWLPILCTILFFRTYIPWLSMSELFPAKAVSYASSLATASNWMFAFIITKTFEDLKGALSFYGVFWLYGSVCFVAIIFVWFFVPETKGKSSEEIQQIFT